MLVRDAEDDRYPYLDKDKGQRRWERGRWRLFRVDACNHDGVHLVVNRHFACLDAEGRWDFVEYVDDGPVKFNDPWSGRDPWAVEDDEQASLRQVAFSAWNDLPDNEKAWVERCVVLPYENVVAIDEDGDEFWHNPHVYVSVSPLTGNFHSKSAWELKTIEQHAPRYGRREEALRVKRFPTKDEALSTVRAAEARRQADLVGDNRNQPGEPSEQSSAISD